MTFLQKTYSKFRLVIFQIFEKIFNYPRESSIFLKKHGYKLNLHNPRSFSEKVIWKKLFDRNPLLPVITNKLRVRDYINEKVGSFLADKLLVPIYFHDRNPELIPFDDLPDQFVIKPNNASGRVILVWDKKLIDQEEIIKQCKSWLAKTHGVYRHEWAYQRINPEIIIEKLLLDDEGKIPPDYKFHIFHGKCKRISVCTGRFERGRNVTSYDEHWNHLSFGTSDPEGPAILKPRHFSKMLEIAQRLGGDFDYIRVDLYNISGRIYFGELTSYPLSGDNRYAPTEFDFKLGSYWKITRDYWKK